MAAKVSNEAPLFIPADEVDDYNRRGPLCSTMTTAIHQLLGHGSGLNLAETEPSVFNFDRENPPISPIDGKQISSWYQFGQTPGSVFRGIASIMKNVGLNVRCYGLWQRNIFGCRGEKGDEGFDERM